MSTTKDRLISARNIACDTEGCEDRAVWETPDGRYCDGCYSFLNVNATRHYYDANADEWKPPARDTRPG